MGGPVITLLEPTVAPAVSRAATVAVSSRSERSSQSLRTASRSTSLMPIVGAAIISPADSDPIDASICAAASSMGSSTW